MRYGSVCSGIEAASVAWEPLGWKPCWFAEIEAFPSAVLDHHWPHVPNLGDMTTIAEKVMSGAVEAPDVLVGGTPCQAFSIAGLRGGLKDARGQLTISYVELANAIDSKRRKEGQPESIIVWENVPGVLSDKTNAFGCFLAGLAGEDEELYPSGKRWPNAGCVFGPQRTVTWIVKDAQYFGVAQRRRRVFVVASARKDIDPTKILFEFEGVRRDIAPSRGAWENTSSDVRQSLASGKQTVGTLLANAGTKLWLGNQEAFTGEYHIVVGSNNEQYTPAISRTLLSKSNDSMAHDLDTYIAFNWQAGGNTASNLGANEHIIGTLQASQHPAVASGLAVRRLMPIECERLQGFPDNHTLIPWRTYQEANRKGISYESLLLEADKRLSEPAGDQCPDGPRYKAVGNSMAVPVMNWIGRRIAKVLPIIKTAGDFGGSTTPIDIRDLWQTPPELYAALNNEFQFVADVAASEANHLHDCYLTESDNALATGWGAMQSGYVWCNPPYSDITPWIKQAEHAALDDVGTVMLVPADMSVGWFKLAMETISEVRIITGGRISFVRSDTKEGVGGNPKGSILLIWHPRQLATKSVKFVDRDEIYLIGLAALAGDEVAA